MPTTIIKSASRHAEKFAAIKANAAKVCAEPKKRRSGHAKPRQPLIPLEAEGYWGTGEILAYKRWSAAKLFNKIKDGSFPLPKKDGNRNVWKTSILRDVLEL